MPIIPLRSHKVRNLDPTSAPYTSPTSPTPPHPSNRRHRPDLRNRPIVHLPCVEEIQHARPTNDTHEQNTRPVEVLRRDRRVIRPETPEKRPRSVDERDNIDRHTILTKRPFRVGELALLVPSPGHTSDGDHVGTHERGGGEGEYSVEGDGRANVDEGDGHREDAGEDDAVDGDVPFRVHLGEPVAKGKAVVTGKGEGLARGGGEGGDGNHNDQEENDGREGGGASCRTKGVLEDVDEREARWGSDRFLEVTDAEEVGDEKAKSHRDVENKSPDHGSRNDGRGALDFLGHVGDGIGAKHDEHGRDLADHHCKRSRGPVGAVGEDQEYVCGSLLGCEDQEDDDDREEGEYVKGHEDTFGKGETFRSKDVEESDANHGCPDEEGALPAGGDVFRVVEDDHALDHDAYDVGVNGDKALPGDG